MWLAFDLGTSGVKAAVLDNDGKIIRSAVEPYPTYTANGGIVEQEVSDWWRALVAAARVVGREVTKIVLTGQMQDLILLNDRGESLRPAILGLAQTIGTKPVSPFGNHEPAKSLNRTGVICALIHTQIFGLAFVPYRGDDRSRRDHNYIYAVNH